MTACDTVPQRTASGRYNAANFSGLHPLKALAQDFAAAATSACDAGSVVGVDAHPTRTQLTTTKAMRNMDAPLMVAVVANVMSRAKPALYAGHCSIYWTYKTPVSGLQPGLPVEKLGKNPIKNLPCNPAPHHCSPLAWWTKCASAYGTCTITSARSRFTFTGCVFSYAGLGAVGKCSTRAGTVKNQPKSLAGQYPPTQLSTQHP